MQGGKKQEAGEEFVFYPQLRHATLQSTVQLYPHLLGLKHRTKISLSKWNLN